MASPTPIPRIVNFEKLGFGMFVHWGVYSVLGQGEWILHHSKMPLPEYEKIKERFRAENFDARQWARMARDAGMRYITITTRHHDGFSLYDTRGLNDWDAPHSGAKRDLIAEFVEGCRAEDIVPVFYHTTLDWHHPEFNNDFPAYLQYLRDSVEILCTQYGEIGGFWFDGYWSKFGADWEEDEFYGMIRKHQPETIIINNPGWTRNGYLTHPELDSMTWESALPEKPVNRADKPKYVACEAEASIVAGSWSYKKHSFKIKTPQEIIRAICQCRRCEANYVLNLTPNADGTIPVIQQGILEQVGLWMSQYGEAIYTGKPSPLVGSDGNTALRGLDGEIYLLVESADAPVAYSGANTPIASIHWLDDGSKLDFIQDINAGLLSFMAVKSPYNGGGEVPRIAKAIPGTCCR